MGCTGGLPGCFIIVAAWLLAIPAEVRADPVGEASESALTRTGRRLVPAPAPSRREQAGVPRQQGRAGDGAASSPADEPASRSRRERLVRSRARQKRHRLRRPGAPECGGLTPIYEHEVVPGETLGQIAGRYGVRRKDILRLNSFANPDLIRPGQHIRVCPQILPRTRVQTIHLVAAGENLHSIAERYGLTVAEMMGFQRGAISNPDRVRIGQRLVVWQDGEVLPDFQPDPGDDGDEDDLDGGVQLLPSRHYHVKHPRLAYGTPKTIGLIHLAIDHYASRAKTAAKITIGDISRRGGGPFPPHVSHRNGRDVDVEYVPLHPAEPRRQGRVRLDNRIDVLHTWELIKSFLRTDSVEYIFVDHRIQRALYQHALQSGESPELLDELFQYPRNPRRAYGIIRHWPGHDDHFHVRFR